MSDGYTYITLSEAAARLGTNTRRIQYLLEKGELLDNGSKGAKRRVKWQGAETQGEAKLNLKDQLTAVQIKKITQQINEGRGAIRQELLDEVMQEAYSRMKPLQELIISLGLTPEQTELLRETWKRTFPNV
jgi:hypothetical protein